MNPEIRISIPEERAATAKDGQLPITVWVEQFEEWHGGPSATADPALDWERAWPLNPSAPASCQNAEECGRRFAQLAKRIQVLEQRSSLSDPGSAPLG